MGLPVEEVNQPLLFPPQHWRLRVPVHQRLDKKGCEYVGAKSA